MGDGAEDVTPATIDCADEGRRAARAEVVDAAEEPMAAAAAI